MIKYSDLKPHYRKIVRDIQGAPQTYTGRKVLIRYTVTGKTYIASKDTVSWHEIKGAL